MFAGMAHPKAMATNEACGRTHIFGRNITRVVVANQAACPRSSRLRLIWPRVAEEHASILAGPRSGEVVDHRLELLALGSGVRPQAGTVRLAAARIEHRHRRLIGVQHLATQQVFLQGLHDWLQAHPALADPRAQRRSRDRQAGAREDRFLAIQRQVIRMLCHQHVREQARSRDALVDHGRWTGRLYQRAAIAARPLAADVTSTVNTPGV